jgi:hypothetical protein
MKDVSKLIATDLRLFPVWRYTGSDSPTETAVCPVKRLPAKSLAASLVGVDVTLACGKTLLALVGNVDVSNPRLTRLFMTLSIYRDDGAVFHLARYHDYDIAERGPDQLARFLNMKREQVFPIAWDVSRFADGDPGALRGVVEVEPRERLTRSEIIALAVP